MALTAKIFVLLIGVVIVKSYHLHHFHQADHPDHPHHPQHPQHPEHPEHPEHAHHPHHPDHPDHPRHPEHPQHAHHPHHPDHPDHPHHPQHPQHPEQLQHLRHAHRPHHPQYSHHPQHPHQHHHHHHHHQGVHDFIHNLFHPGIYEDLFGSGLFGNGDSAPLQDGYLYPIQDMGQDENNTPVDIGSDYEDHEGDPDENYGDYITDIPYEPQISDENDSDSHEIEAPIGSDYEDHEGVGYNNPDENNADYTTDIPHEPQIADEHDSDSHETEAPTVTVDIRPNEEPKPDDEGNRVDHNQPRLNIEEANDDLTNHKVPGFLDEDIKKGIVMVDPNSINDKVPGFLDEDIKKGIVMVDPNSINDKVPGFLDEDIKKGIVMVDPNSINDKVPGFLDEDIKKGIVMVDPNSINDKVPGFLDEDIKKGIVMVDPNSINDKVPGFLDEDIKKGIVMVTPELKHNINEVNKPKVSADAGLDATDGNNAVLTLSLQNNPEEKEVNSNQDRNVITVPGFNDNDVEEGIIMVDPELKYNINAGHEPIVPDPNVANETIKENGDNNVNIGSSTDEPKLSHTIIDESQFSETLEPDHKKAVLGFGDEEIKEGILMIDPESKIIDTDKGLDKYVVADGIVFPDEVKEQNKVNLRHNRVNRSDNTNQYPSVTAPVLTTTVQPSINNIQGQWIAPNSIAQTIPTSNNQGNLNQPSNLVFVQNPNQQLPVNNGNGYVNVVRNPNGEYTVVSIPNSNPGNSGVNKPSQIYIPGNSGVNKPSQIYIPGNSGVSNPGQAYVTDNSGANSPGQIYVPNNVPSSGTPAGNGGLYNVIHLNNGQTVYVPVNSDQSNGNGQNAQWNGQPNNGQIYVPGNTNQGQGYQVLGNNPTGTVTLGSTGTQMNGGYVPPNNVPLLISYKEKDGADQEESEISDSQRDRKEE